MKMYNVERSFMGRQLDAYVQRKHPKQLYSIHYKRGKELE